MPTLARRHTVVRKFLAVALLFMPVAALGQGGPPLIVDDPDTPGPGHWEINVATVFERSRGEKRFEAPLADINYGLGRRIQLKLELPWVSVLPAGEHVHTGVGNALAGVKWRFLGEEGRRIAWSTYPQVEIVSAGSMSDRGFVSDGVQVFLPTELTVQLGALEINGEVGRLLVRNGTNEWAYGLSTELELPRVELLAELHGQRRDGDSTELIAELGWRPKITEQLRLLVAGGGAMHGPSEDRTRVRIYVGCQLNLPRAFVFQPRRVVPSLSPPLPKEHSPPGHSRIRWLHEEDRRLLVRAQQEVVMTVRNVWKVAAISAAAAGLMAIAPASALAQVSGLPQKDVDNYTITGCFVMESVGGEDIYVLRRPIIGAPDSVPEANCAAVTAGAEKIRLRDVHEQVHKHHLDRSQIGSWIAVTGRLSDFDKHRAFRDFHVMSFRVVPVVPPKAAAVTPPTTYYPPAAVPLDVPPAPLEATPVATSGELPKTASPLPTIALIGLLSLAAGVALRLAGRAS